MIGGTATLKALPFGHKDPPPAPAITTNASPQVVREGKRLYDVNCPFCHGMNAVAGPLPDLRYLSKEKLEGIEDIVLGGSRAAAGMPSFAKILNPQQVHAIQAYLIARTRESSKQAAR
jgi:mono/diheme cytochrome c family protein